MDLRPMPQVQCLDCLVNKSHKLPYFRSTLSSSQALELIYSDVWGSAPSSSINGHFYCVIFTDHFSKYVWLYLVKHKFDVSHIFQYSNYLLKIN